LNNSIGSNEQGVAMSNTTSPNNKTQSSNRIHSSKKLIPTVESLEHRVTSIFPEKNLKPQHLQTFVVNNTTIDENSNESAQHHQ
jgi:hypothetical protein